MIKISKKYLTKIIKEETKRIVEGWDDEGSYTDKAGLGVSDAEFEEPPAWRDADELTTTTFEVIAPVINGFLESKDCVEEKELNGLYIELEKALHDRSMGLVGEKPAPADDDDYVEDDQGEGEHLEMDRYIADQGPLDKDEDLMQEEDKDWIQKADLKKGRCANPGDEKCPKGSPQYNLAMNFKHGSIHKANLKRGKNPHGPG